MSDGNVVYESTAKYLKDSTRLCDKIAKLNLIIDALFLVATEAAESDNITEYTLDSGQTKIKTAYRGAESVFKSIQAYENLKTMYQNKLVGRGFKLMDSKNFRTR
tara:strand:- start:788 stop:1102 length:315 start_codon:yes stop_codon:yes gene_type:complete